VHLSVTVQLTEAGRSGRLMADSGQPVRNKTLLYNKSVRFYIEN
jgi:hypothetical protein